MNITRNVGFLLLTILALTSLWLFSFFGQAISPRIPHLEGFIYILSVAIISLILMKFLT